MRMLRHKKLQQSPISNNQHATFLFCPYLKSLCSDGSEGVQCSSVNHTLALGMDVVSEELLKILFMSWLHSYSQMAHMHLNKTGANCMEMSAGTHVEIRQNCIMYISINTEYLHTVQHWSQGKCFRWLQNVLSLCRFVKQSLDHLCVQAPPSTVISTIILYNFQMWS